MTGDLQNQLQAMDFLEMARDLLASEPNIAASALSEMATEEAAEVLREMKLQNKRKTEHFLACMDPAASGAICIQAGIEPGGATVGGTHDVTILIVYNSLKRVLSFSEFVRKNKGSKGVLEASIEKTAKQAFDILVGKHSNDGGAVEDILEGLRNLKIQRVGLPGNRLGLEKARQLYEEVIGDLDDHIDYPSHADPPAPIHVAELEANTHTPDSKSDHGRSDDPAHELPNVGTMPVLIIKFSQSKSWLPSALLEGPALQREREALVRAGFSPKLPSGAKIFVPPEAFLQVTRHLEMQGLKLKTSHVVISADLEDKLMAVVEAAREVATRRERGSCKVKSRMELSVKDEDHVRSGATVPHYEVKRTFIHVPIPSSMHSTLSIQPSTV